MGETGSQLSLFGFDDELTDVGSVSAVEGSPADQWGQESAKRALDDLFSHTTQYRSSSDFYDLLSFIRRFRFYAPFNAMLVHTQMPGATYVAPAHRWRHDFGRLVRTGARPLVILQPMGPVMFVFDVSDTEPTKNGIPLPPEVERPFEVNGTLPVGSLERLIENAKRDGIRIIREPAGSQSAGSIRWASAEVLAVQDVQSGMDKKTGEPTYVQVPVRYDMVVNSKHKPEVQYATIAHELAHLYCGHLGAPNPEHWPNRLGLNLKVREFEAESVAFLVCGRAGIESPSAEYLEGYLDANREVPSISLECVLKAAGLIETMSRQKLPPRKTRARPSAS